MNIHFINDYRNMYCVYTGLKYMAVRFMVSYIVQDNTHETIFHTHNVHAGNIVICGLPAFLFSRNMRYYVIRSRYKTTMAKEDFQGL